MKRLLLCMSLCVAFGAAGCAELQDLAISSRNRNAAYSAWKVARWDYWRQGVSHTVREHISRGFRQGYYDVAQGGSGKVPMFPPQDYWGVRYQNPTGNEFVAAWFRGYSDGAMAAERDGIGFFNQIPTSSAPQGTMTAAYNDGSYPVPPPGESVPPPPPADMPVPPTVDLPGTVNFPPGQEDVPLRAIDQPAGALPVPMATPPALSAPITTPANPSGAPSTAPAAPNTPMGNAAPKVDAPAGGATKTGAATIQLMPPGPAPSSGTTSTAPTTSSGSGAAVPPPMPLPQRDPIGGKQTSVEIQALSPVARQALFGEEVQ